MRINIPEVIYILTDLFMKPFIWLLVSSGLISKRLEKEEEYFEEDHPMDYPMKTLGTIHERASSMVSHLSLMLGLCLFLMQSEKIALNSIEHKIVTIDAIFYIILVLLTVRCLRSFGLDKDYDTKEQYLQHIHQELVFKYQIMQVVNAFTIVATVILVAAMMFEIYA